VRRITIACLAAVFGCAAPTHEKMSWAEAMPLPAPRPHKSPPRDPLADPKFEAALQGFQDGAQAARKSAENGAAMAAPQVQAWDELLGRVDAFLQKAPGFTSLLDAARARAVVEGELELDAQAYGDIPLSTAQGAQAAAKRLAGRVHDLLALQQLKRVSPLRFVWPVSPVVITSPFGDRVHPITGDYRMHRGVDLAAGLAQPVYAAFAGTVVFAGWNGAHGKQVQLVHDGHWSTHYSHLSNWSVQSGDVVAKGQLIGVAGSTGESTGPHVHFELVHDGETVDPEEELPPPPEVPLPVALQ
jgi:murein DD-endopeptidase MepM/ murein hydrolase activator NlpD